MNALIRHLHPIRPGWAFLRQRGQTYEVYRRETEDFRCVLTTHDRAMAQDIFTALIVAGMQ